MYRIFTSVFKINLFTKRMTLRRMTFSTSVIYSDTRSMSRQVERTHQSVADFYAGKSVFVTGATGFIGRVLIERLLYTCSDIDKIYILIRAKKTANVQQRLEELLHNPIFTKLKKVRPQDLDKIVPIAGDVGDARLGMNQEDEQTLIETVSVVFHSAANVKFRAPLSDLLQVNYEGTKKVMELGKKIKNLNIFVHVSTAFHNSNLVIEEKTYPPPSNIEDVYNIIAHHSNDPNRIRNLLGRWGNSYVFSKNMAEAYVASDHGNMRTMIVRPSMVTSVYKEPLVGYTDSWVTGTVLLCDMASGLTRVVHGKKDVVVEIIPADYVCNFLIVAAAKNFMNNECNVYNMSTGHSNPIVWGKLIDIYIKEGKKHNYEVMPFPAVYFTKSSWMRAVLIFLIQILPAFTADLFLQLTRRKPRYIQLQKKAIFRADLSKPVTDSSWDIRTTRAQELISTLDITDRSTFPCDPVTVNWDKYIPIYCKGVKDYMLHYRNGKNK